MTANEAREASLAVAKSLMTMIFTDIQRASSEGRLYIDYDMQDDLHDLYDYFVVAELEKMGYSVNTTSRTSSSSETGDRVIRYMRICWYPKA